MTLDDSLTIVCKSRFFQGKALRLQIFVNAMCSCSFSPYNLAAFLAYSNCSVVEKCYEITRLYYIEW